MNESDAGSGDLDWSIKLEAALIEGCDAKTLQFICQGRSVFASVRPDVWQIALGVEDLGDVISTEFDGLFDLTNQSELREDCRKLVEDLGNTEAEQLPIACDLETIVTFYCKITNQQYESDNGWSYILKPLLAQGYSKSILYNCFQTIISKYLPKDKNDKYSLPCQLFRLLLLYHEPELCSFLDSKRIVVDDYFTPWFKSLFSSVCDLESISAIWDVYFLLDDSFFIFYLPLVILINSKSLIMEMKDSEKQEIIGTILTLPSTLSSEDVKDFCDVAHYYNSRTPQSFRNVYKPAIYTMNTAPSLPQQLCLPVHVSELLQMSSASGGGASGGGASEVRYHLTDCRPAEQYNAGHLSTAYHLDFNLMLNRPSEFETELKSLLNSQIMAFESDSIASGSHLCFIGSGKPSEDQYLHMIISNMLRRYSKYVSICVGGYQEMHDILVERGELREKMVDHAPDICLCCQSSNNLRKSSNKNEVQQSSNLINKFGLLSTAVKTKSMSMKEKMINYIKNEQNNSNCHASPEDVGGKRYRSMQDVFTMGDEDDEDSLTEASDMEKNFNLDPPNRDYEDLDAWLQKSDVLYSCACLELRPPNETFNSILALTEDCLIVLRVVIRKPKQKGYITTTRPLDSIVKISSNKTCQERISFKYGERDNDNELVISACDRFLIPRASEAIRKIKIQIEKLYKPSKDT